VYRTCLHFFILKIYTSLYTSVCVFVVDDLPKRTDLATKLELHVSQNAVKIG